MNLDKAVRYVARAASDPFLDSEIDVNTLGTVSSNQWWIEHTPLVPVPEVSFQELVAMHNGHLILKGQSGKSLSPNVVLSSSAIDAKHQFELFMLATVMSDPNIGSRNPWLGPSLQPG